VDTLAPEMRTKALAEDEQIDFLQMLSEAMDSVKSKYEQVRAELVHEEKCEVLQHLQQQIDVVASCLEHQHCGSQDDWRTSTAKATIDGVLDAFSSTPDLKACLGAVGQWCMSKESEGNDTDDTQQSLVIFAREWEAVWTDMKKDLIMKEQWELLQQLATARSALSEHMASSRLLTESDYQMVRNVLQALKSTGCFSHIQSLERCITTVASRGQVESGERAVAKRIQIQ